MRTPGRPNLARPVIFGLADGAMSILGVIFYMAGHTSLVMPVAVSGGLSAAVSMAGGEWLSDSAHGLRAATAIGASTLAGSVLPAIPYTILHGAAALAASVGALTAVAAVVAFLRRGQRRHPWAETAAVLTVVLLVAFTCAVVMPGGGGA